MKMIKGLESVSYTEELKIKDIASFTEEINKIVAKMSRETNEWYREGRQRAIVLVIP